MFDTASPKLTFLFGLVLGLAIVSVIGFIFLLVTRTWGTGTAKADTAYVPPAPTAAADPTPSAPTVGAFRPVDDTDHIRGNANAPITMIEYSDTECPFCKVFHTTMNDIVKQYDGKVRWVYRYFPLRQLHSKAAKEAEAAECAANLGGNAKFWEYLDRIFATTGSNDSLDPAELPKVASAIGLNQQKFTACLNSGKMATRVSQDERDAVQAGGRGTPYTVIITPDGQKIPLEGALPVSEVQSILDPIVSKK